MKRGDLVVVSAPGDYGKPRPAVLVQCPCRGYGLGGLIGEIERLAASQIGQGL